MDLELLDSIHPFQGRKSLQGYFGCTRNKLEEPRPVGLVKGTQCSPEPLYLHRANEDNSINQWGGHLFMEVQLTPNFRGTTLIEEGGREGEV